MFASHRPIPRRVRTIFVSDVHLGWKKANANAFLDFIRRHEADYVYIVGDLIDGWRLKRLRDWQPVYSRILCRFVQMSSAGTRVYYAPGNHDAFMRNFVHDFGIVEIADEFIHDTADGLRYLVTHGDQFDAIECRARWLSMFGAGVFDMLSASNYLINLLRGALRLKPCDYCTPLKTRVKQRVVFTDKFRKKLVRYVEEKDCDGIICGHTHWPKLSRLNDIVYCNTGDWVDNCTAAVEHEDGRLELVNVCDELTQETQLELFSESMHDASIDTVVAATAEAAADA